MKYSIFGFAILLYITSSPAFAYIDPGMGSMWIQGLIALGAGFLVTLRMYWQRFKLFLFSIKNKVTGMPHEKDVKSTAAGNKIDG